jgi:hypothetical protein
MMLCVVGCKKDEIIEETIEEKVGISSSSGTTATVGTTGGEVQFRFSSNAECKVVIPEDAQSWISVISPTRAWKVSTITLKIAPNKEYYRTAVIKVQSHDGSVTVEYAIEQAGDLGVVSDTEVVPEDEIWYVMSDGSVYDVYQNTNIYGHQPFNRNVVSNTIIKGKGVIKFDGAVTRINDHTFGDVASSVPFIDTSKIIELHLPDNIEYIGTGGITGSGLKTFRVPANLKIIGEYGISDNPNLEKFTGSHVSEDGKCVIIDKTMYAFAPKGIKEYTIPTGVETIGYYVFTLNNELESIVIPEGVVKILGEAFSDCSALKSITLPSTLEKLDSYAFIMSNNIEGFYGNEKFHTPDNKCLISNTNVYGENTGPVICGFAGKGITEYVIPEGITGIGNYAFGSGTSLRNVTLPSTLTMVGSTAFEGCALEAVYGPNTSEDHRCIVFGTNLKLLAARRTMPANYSVPDNITSIGDWAFSKCYEISVTMGDQVTTLGGYAFADCPNLKSVTLSAELKSIGGIGTNPFLGSDNLESIYCRAVMPPSYNDTQMQEFPKLKFYVPEQSLELYKNHPSWGLFSKYMVGYKYDDLPEVDYYYMSSDFSQDGEVATLQTATKGKGIDIVLLGNGYSDRQIADGTYDNTMAFVTEKLFTEEPYKSFRDHFNVYSVKAVSEIEGDEYFNFTAFGCSFNKGIFVEGSHQTMFSYAQKALGSERSMNDVLVIMMVNSKSWGGRCYNYSPTTGDYGDGSSIAYISVGTDETSIEQLLHHEAMGHGFAKLADEYVEYGDIMPTSKFMEVKEEEPYGWWKNADFTNDPATIKWNYFLSDPRYANEGLGAYEGAFGYATEVWRPTDNSIMRYNTGGFNAPSREAIYYRIHKLAYGSVWTYNYEDFVAYDAINRKAAETTRGVPYRMDKPKGYKHHPPVVINHSWREAK